MNTIAELDELIIVSGKRLIQNIKQVEEETVKEVITKLKNSNHSKLYEVIESLFFLSNANYSLSFILERISNEYGFGLNLINEFPYWESESKEAFRDTLQAKIKGLEGKKGFVKHVDETFRTKNPEEHGKFLLSHVSTFLELLTVYNNPEVHSKLLINRLSKLEPSSIITIRNLISEDRLTHISQGDEEVLEHLKKSVKKWYQESELNFLEKRTGYHQPHYFKYYRYILNDAQAASVKRAFLEEYERKVVELKDISHETSPDEVISSAGYLKKIIEDIESFE